MNALANNPFFKDFDKLFEVKSEAYEWWQEESTTLDDF